MQISFDPLKYDEQQAVYKMLVALGVAGGSVNMQPAVAEVATPLAPQVPDAPSSADVAPPPTAPAVIEGFSPQPPTDAAPPVPPAPAAVVHMAAVAPTTHVSGAEVDIHGMPWDGRIHSESRAKLADGSWRRRRNTADEVFAQVEAELKAAMAGGVPLAPAGGVPQTAPPVTASATPAVPPSPAGGSPLAPPAPTMSAPVSAPIPSAPPVPEAPTAAAPSAPATGANTWTFPAVVQAVNAKVQAGKLANDSLNTALMCVGLQAGQLVKLATATPETLAAFMQAIENV